MATEYGWIQKTTTCPTCSLTDVVVVFGGNADVINKSVTCSHCGELYSAEITITFTGSVANYAHT